MSAFCAHPPGAGNGRGSQSGSGRNLAGRGSPVAKILDTANSDSRKQKKAAEARKKQKVIEIKEIKMRR